MPRRSSRSSVSSNSDPRGTAIRNSLMAGASSAATFLAGQRDVQPLDVQREADGGQRSAELTQQLVVASADPDGIAVGRVVDLEHRAGVVAEAADQAEVEDDPAGHLGRLAGRVRRASRWRRARAGRERLQDLGAPRRLRDGEQERGVLGWQAERVDLVLQADEIAVGQLGQDPLAAFGVDAEAVEQRRSRARRRPGRPVGLEARRVEGVAEDGQDLRRALRRGAPISSIPAWRNSRD